MKTWLKRLTGGQRGEDGQAAFEFLMILPIFVLFMLLVVDLGVAMYEYVGISNGVREGARYAAVNCGSDAPCTAQKVYDRASAHDGLGSAIPGSEYVPRWDLTSGLAKKGNAVSVKATHTYNFLFFPALHLTLTACSEMALEADDAATGLTGPAAC